MAMIVIFAAIIYYLFCAKCCSNCLISLQSFSIHNNPMDNIILTLTQKMRWREEKRLAYSHIASNGHMGTFHCCLISKPSHIYQSWSCFLGEGICLCSHSHSFSEKKHHVSLINWPFLIRLLLWEERKRGGLKENLKFDETK